MSLVRKAGTLALGNGLAQGINIIGIIALSRLYTPADFGVFAVVFGAAAILGSTASLRYEVSILLPRSDYHANTALQLSVLFSVLVNTAAFILLTCLVLLTGLKGYILLIAPVGLFLSIINIAGFYQNRKEMYWKSACVQIFRVLLFVMLSIGLGLHGQTEYGLLYGLLASVLLPGMYLFFTDIRASGSLSGKIYSTRLIAWARKHKKFFYYSTPAVFVNSLAMQVPVFALSGLYGASAAGYYGIINRLILGPVNLVSGAVNRIYMREVSWKRAHGEPVFAFTFGLVKRFFAASLAASIIMYTCFHYKIVEQVFGAHWQNIDSLMTIMIPVFFTAFIAKSIAGFAVLDRNELGLFYQIALLCATSAAIALAWLTSDDVSVAFMWISAALTLCFAAQMLSILKISHQISRNKELSE